MVLSAIFVACGRREDSDVPPATITVVTQAEQQPQQPVQIDPRLDAVVNEFLEDCSRYDVRDLCDQQLQMMQSVTALPDADMPKNAKGETPMGICFYNHNAQNPVKVVLRESLLQAPNALKWVAYHEFGHCILGKGHTKSRDDLIMHTTYLYVAVTDKMVKQLFTTPAEPIGEPGIKLEK
jgi:hypothetical protein